MFEFPLLRLGKFVEKLGGVRFWRSMAVGRVISVRDKYNGIISQSFSLICRGYPRLFLLLGLLSGIPEISGAALVLAPVANISDFFWSLFFGSRVNKRLRISQRLLRSDSRGTWRHYWGVAGDDSGGCL
jgi:hypothetical protein